MNVREILLDAAPFSLLAMLCGMTSPVWLACLVSLFVPNRTLRLGTGITTALAGLFILAMGVIAWVGGSYGETLAYRYADPTQAAELERASRQHAMNAFLILAPFGALPLVLGSLATGLGARTSRAENT